LQSQLHRCRADGHGAGADLRFGTDALAGGDGRLKEAIEDAIHAVAGLAQLLGFFHLREDLPFSQHQAI